MPRKNRDFHVFGEGFSAFGSGLKPLDPLPEDQGFGSSFSPFMEKPKGSKRGSVQDLMRQEQDLTGVARAAGVMDVLRPPLSAVSTVADFLSRPNYAIAGAARELQDGGNVGQAMERFGQELFRGVPGVEGAQKETFADVLEHAGYSEGPSVPAPFGWGKISARGTLGLALDIALDPLTYLTFGGAKAIKVLGEGGKVVDAVSLSKAGREAVQEISKEVRPEKMRLAEFLARGAPVDVPGAPLRARKWLQKSMDVNALADRYAYEEAVARVAQRAASGERHLLDEGGLKWFGQTMIPGEAFGRSATHIKGAVSSTLAKTSPGRALLSHYGTMKTKGGEVVSQVDKVFNELGRVARKVPGFQESITALRDTRHRMMRFVAQDIDNSLPEAMSKIKVDTTGLSGADVAFRVANMPLDQYIMHHIDNPTAYPAELIPPGYRDVPNYAAGTFSEIFEKETRLGLVEAEHFRPNYVPHMYSNSQKELSQFSEFFKAGRAPFANTENRFAYGEMRGFGTLDEAMAKSRELKAQGKIDFDLKPITDFRNNWYRRMEAHWNAVTTEELVTELKGIYGRSFGEAVDWMDQHFMPGIIEAVSKRPTVSKAVGQKVRASGVLPAEGESRELINKLTRWIKTPLAKAGTSWLSKQTPELQAAAIIGKLRNAKGLSHVHKILELHGDRLGQLEPKLVNDINMKIDGVTRKYADVLGKDYRFVREGKFKDYFMPDAIVREIEGMGEHLINSKEVGKLIQTFDSVNRLFKVGVTLYHPAFHVRNAYSNVATNFVALGLRGLNPMSYIEAARVFNPQVDGTFRTVWRRYTYDEMRDMMVRFGIFKDFAQISELTQTGRSQINRFVAGEIGPPGVKQFNKMASTVGSGIENTSRGMLFMKYLQDGHVPEEAAMLVKKFLFDYEQLSKTERDVLARLFPFYRWTKKNISLTAQELVRQPGKYATMFKGVREGDSGPEADALPYYLRGNLKIKLQKGPGRATFVQGLDLPVTAALNTIFTKDVLTTLRQNMGMIAPAIKVLPELALKRDFFSGRDMQQRAQVNALGKWFFSDPFLRNFTETTQEFDPQTGEMNYRMNGTKAYLLFRSYAHSRFLNEFDKLATDPEDLQKFTLFLVAGLQGKDVDLTMDQKKILRQRIRTLEDRLVERGVLRASQQTYTPKGVTY